MNIILKDPYGNQVFSVESYDKEKKTDFIFIRLYDPTYKGINVSNVLKKCISITEVNAVKTSHASIGFNLKDAFYGLTYDIKKRDGKLKKESCTNPGDNAYMQSCDPNKSSYIVYALPVTKAELSKAKSLVNKSFNNPNVVYGVSINFALTIPSITRKLRDKRIDGSVKSHDAKRYRHQSYESSNDIKNVKLTDEERAKFNKHKFCCSTFVTAVLYHSIPSIKKFFDDNKINIERITPSDLTTLPGLMRLFSGNYKSYNGDKEKFISKHPEFNRYK